jgi:hypothetical protein
MRTSNTTASSVVSLNILQHLVKQLNDNVVKIKHRFYNFYSYVHFSVSTLIINEKSYFRDLISHSAVSYI